MHSIRNLVRRLAFFAIPATAWLLTVPLVFADSPTGQAASSSPSEKATAQLVIDFGDGFQLRYTELDCANGATVWDLMLAAQSHPHPLSIKHRGKGATLLITEIAGTKNGAGPESKNWIYRVNGEIVPRSAGVQPVKPGDTVLWRFETYR